jgi:hypothetical protein
VSLARPGKPRPETKRPRRRKVRPFVKPGETLGFAAELKKKRKWPPDKVDRPPSDAPTATAYMVVQADSNDLGARPLPGPEALHSQSLQILDGSGAAVTRPVRNTTYRLRCQAVNLGATAAFGGLADFYVAAPAQFDGIAGTGATMPGQGHTGFAAYPGHTVTIDSPNTWRPATDAEAASSVLVHVYDPFLDPLVAPFDARADRHVGRLDPIPDFAGLWNGTSTIVGDPSGRTFLERIVITQSVLNVTVQFYSEVGSPPALPANPQITVSGTIIGQQIPLSAAELIGGAPFTSNQIVLTLTAPNNLHFDWHREFVMPGDTRPDQDLIADLQR